MGFHDQLRRSWETSNSLLCVGLDPDPDRLPTPLQGDPDAVFRFCAAIVDATHDLVCAFKPQFAHFASQRAEPALERLCHYIRERYPDVTLVLDAKRGDIGSTAEHYAREAFDRYAAHAVTINPYLGLDSALPYFDHDGGVIVLCHTSNPGSVELQEVTLGGRPLFVHVAGTVATRWAEHGECGLVVGATFAQQLADVRQVASTLPILVPGVGAQGGDPAAVRAAGATADGYGLMISSSRQVLYASSGDDFAEAARRAAERTLAPAVS